MSSLKNQVPYLLKIGLNLNDIFDLTSNEIDCITDGYVELQKEINKTNPS